MSDPARNNIDVAKLPVSTEKQTFNDWTVSYTQSHILHSQCTGGTKCIEDPESSCQFCKYTNTLSLPHLPEMVFPNNILSLAHSTGARIEFNAFDALKLISTENCDIKVYCSEVWKETRDPANLEEKKPPFDWTFSTEYRGTLSGPFDVTPTDERIDIERLKVKDEILFYHELMLYEDELHDNGIASCTVKIRVMPSSFFVLLRFFLRVDGVMVRINDTRVFHDFSTNYVLREFTNKECSVRHLKLPLRMFGDPTLISPHMPLKQGIYEKLTWKQKENGE